MAKERSRLVGSAVVGSWPDRLRAGLLVVVIGAAGHLVWEIGQLPLYTIWKQGTRNELVFAVAHCTAGDVLITAIALGAAIVLARAWSWPSEQWIKVSVLTIVIGAGYTAFSEWLNVYVRGAWGYGSAMPTVHFGQIGIGLSPLSQWLIVPFLALTLTRYLVQRVMKRAA